MREAPLPTDTVEALRALDTPTVCNALEAVAPDRRGHGYTVWPFYCPRPELPPMVGYARTASIRAMQPSTRGARADRDARLAYYDYVGAGHRPSVVVIEDLDPVAGYGAWWGEVHTNVHRGLGAEGVVTNGSIRDLDDSAPGFRLLAGMAAPSHAWVHVVEFGAKVTVHGMTVESGDLVHADRHGAVVVPLDLASEIPGAATEIAAQERLIIDASRSDDFDADALGRLLGPDPGH